MGSNSRRNYLDLSVCAPGCCCSCASELHNLKRLHHGATPETTRSYGQFVLITYTVAPTKQTTDDRQQPAIAALLFLGWKMHKALWGGAVACLTTGSLLASKWLLVRHPFVVLLTRGRKNEHLSAFKPYLPEER